MRPSADLNALLRLYEDELLENVIPWWMAHGIDRKYGGPLETITEDGRAASTDKPVWSVGRALFIWSLLYNRIGRRPEWLEVADRIVELIVRIGPRVGWIWPQTLRRDGTPAAPSRNLYNDGFILMGLSEYIRATGSVEAIAAARATWETVSARMVRANAHLAGEHDLGPDAACHGISMIFSLVGHELGKTLADAAILAAGHDHARRVQDLFTDERSGLVREYRGADGTDLDGPMGRACIAGHAIESAWFAIQILRDRHERARLSRAVAQVRAHVEAAWDEQCGGLFGTIDAETGEPLGPDARKNMWPHTEALYALLLCHEVSGEAWCLEWYDRLHEWSWAHFPNRAHGEWHRVVERDGSFPWGVDGPGPRPRKEPFHLPRMLIMTVELLRRLGAERGALRAGGDA